MILLEGSCRDLQYLHIYAPLRPQNIRKKSCTSFAIPKLKRSVLKYVKFIFKQNFLFLCSILMNICQKIEKNMEICRILPNFVKFKISWNFRNRVLSKLFIIQSILSLASLIFRRCWQRQWLASSGALVWPGRSSSPRAKVIMMSAERIPELPRRTCNPKFDFD